MKRIYLTHCSAKKDDSLKGTGKKVPPDKLYTANPLQRFVQRCKQTKVDWAIFSDKYGVVFPSEKISWYEKHPNSVSTDEFQSLLSNFYKQLSDYEEIWFYRNPGRFHHLYDALVKEARIKGMNVVLFSHINEIG